METTLYSSKCPSWGSFGRLELCSLNVVVCHCLFRELSKNSSLSFLGLRDNDLPDIEVKKLKKPLDMSRCAPKELL